MISWGTPKAKAARWRIPDPETRKRGHKKGLDKSCVRFISVRMVSLSTATLRCASSYIGETLLIEGGQSRGKLCAQIFGQKMRDPWRIARHESGLLSLVHLELGFRITKRSNIVIPTSMIVFPSTTTIALMVRGGSKRDNAPIMVMSIPTQNTKKLTLISVGILSLLSSSLHLIYHEEWFVVKYPKI